jgi:uncharacterized NAD-dependent epimerase/dehydratase family protein
MTLDEFRIFWIYAMKEAYLQGYNDGTKFINRVHDFLSIDPDIAELAKNTQEPDMKKKPEWFKGIE